MKKLFKFIFKLILFVIILVVIIVAGVFIAITSKVDDAPVKEYDTTATFQSLLGAEMGDSLDHLAENYSIDIIFDQKELNNLLYAVGKKLNESYNPGKDDPTADEKYIKAFEIPDTIPLVGGKAMGVKNLYGEVDTENEEVTVFVTADVAEKIKTRIFFTFTVETTDDSYNLIISKLKFGKINLLNGLAVKALVKADVASMVNNALKDLPFTLEFEDKSCQLVCKKTDFNDFVKGMINGDGASEGDMKSEFVNLLLDPSRDMLKFGMFANGFGVKIDLECLRVDASKTVIDESVKEGFDTSSFIEAQAQSLIINSIYSTTGDKFLSISESDMTKLIYQNMLKDSTIEFNTEILAGANLSLKLEGITFDIDDKAEHLLINIIMNINGLKTTAVLTGDINQAAAINDEVRISLDNNKLKLGKDVEIDSAFLTDILKDNFSNSDIMKFENGQLVFSSAVFSTMLSTAMEGKDTPLTVSGLGFVKDNLRIYVEYTDTALSEQIEKVTASLKSALETGIELDMSKFTPEEAAKAEEVQDKLDEIKNKDITTITAEDTDELMSLVGEMSSESQEAFFESVTNSVDETELQALYDLMFANK